MSFRLAEEATEPNINDNPAIILMRRNLEATMSHFFLHRAYPQALAYRYASIEFLSICHSISFCSIGNVVQRKSQAALMSDNFNV